MWKIISRWWYNAKHIRPWLTNALHQQQNGAHQEHANLQLPKSPTINKNWFLIQTKNCIPNHEHMQILSLLVESTNEMLFIQNTRYIYIACMMNGIYIGNVMACTWLSTKVDQGWHRLNITFFWEPCSEIELEMLLVIYHMLSISICLLLGV
jgi:hypothetical protein